MTAVDSPNHLEVFFPLLFHDVSHQTLPYPEVHCTKSLKGGIQKDKQSLWQNGTSSVIVNFTYTHSNDSR